MKSVLAAVLAAAALGVAIGGSAYAQAAATTAASAPGGAFSFQKPAKWPGLDLMSKAGSPVTEYVSGTADQECYFDVVPRAETATATPSQIVKAWKTPVPAAGWVTATQGQFLLRDGPGTLVSTNVDTSKTFPVQTAVLKNAKNTVYVAVHARPGQEIWAYCAAYDGKDHAADLTAVASSVTTAKDAEYAEAMTAADAAAAAAAAAAAPKGKEKK